jgi:TRAP-type C4-dicarboxylate transport system permease small subunit
MRTISHLLEVTEDSVLAFATWASITISVVGVFFRYVLNNSLSWMEEMAGYLLLYIVTIGVATAVRKGSHLRVDMLIQFFPRTKTKLDVLANAVALILMVILFVLSIGFVFSLLKEDRRTTSLYWLPLGIPLIIMPVGYLITIFRLIEGFLKILTKPSDNVASK